MRPTLSWCDLLECSHRAAQLSHYNNRRQRCTGRCLHASISPAKNQNKNGSTMYYLGQIPVRPDEVAHRPVHDEERWPVRPLLDRLGECVVRGQRLVRRDKTHSLDRSLWVQEDRHGGRGERKGKNRHERGACKSSMRSESMRCLRRTYVTGYRATYLGSPKVGRCGWILNRDQGL